MKLHEAEPRSANLYESKPSESLSRCSSIHLARIHKDPMYHFFFFPEHENFLQEFLRGALAIIRKKYGPYVLDDPEVAYALDHLFAFPEDVVAIRFAILFMLRWEPQVSKAMESAYDQVNPFKTTLHYRKFIQLLHEFVEKTIHFSYNAHNIIEIVTEFEKAARLEYMMGPLTTNSKSSV